LVGVVFGGVVFGGGEGSGDIFGGAALSVFVFPFVSCLSVVLFAGDLDRTFVRLGGAAAADDDEAGTGRLGGAAADDDEAAAEADFGTGGAGSAAADDEAAAEANGIGPGSLPKFFTTKSLTLARFFASFSSASIVLFRNSSAAAAISSSILLSWSLKATCRSEDTRADLPAK
jgi:hypothetical protein